MGQGARTSVRGASSFRPQTGIQNQLCALVADLSLSLVFHLTLHQLQLTHFEHRTITFLSPRLEVSAIQTAFAPTRFTRPSAQNWTSGHPKRVPLSAQKVRHSRSYRQPLRRHGLQGTGARKLCQAE